MFVLPPTQLHNFMLRNLKSLAFVQLLDNQMERGGEHPGYHHLFTSTSPPSANTTSPPPLATPMLTMSSFPDLHSLLISVIGAATLLSPWLLELPYRK
ncbi:hypothetical protein RHMOL_Rhmol04G0365000 [Rhododendron molle]|uniref:Uncharacterized protein n=1 Tax=Rhododendron molle TaxID=49168 RepID=A0ACC0P8B2_RHOML|nr:hypothetical protein RHMOL_Rhmol04G0365000 [Rhododendron molle]